MVSWCRLKDTYKGNMLYVFNTHFDDRGEVARKESAILLRHFADSIAATQPVIICGDLNSTDNSNVYDEMIKKTDQGTFRDAGYGKSAGTYAAGFGAKRKFSNRIDYIFYSTSLAQKSYLVISDHKGKNFPSDHKPVMAEFLFP